LRGGIVWADHGPPHACYVNVTKSCAAFWANTTRVCYNGPLAIPCGDVIVENNDVADIRQARPGESGFTGWAVANTVNVVIDFWACVDDEGGQICEHLGEATKQCQGRQADDNSNECSVGNPGS